MRWSKLLSIFISMFTYDKRFASSSENPFTSIRKFELMSIFFRFGNLTFLSDFRFVILFCQSKSSSNDSALRVDS